MSNYSHSKNRAADAIVRFARNDCRDNLDTLIYLVYLTQHAKRSDFDDNATFITNEAKSAHVRFHAKRDQCKATLQRAQNFLRLFVDIDIEVRENLERQVERLSAASTYPCPRCETEL